MAAGRSDTDAFSDTESVTALLTPSDGYFSPTDVPNDMLVPDPQQRNTQADKEREAREEQQNQQQQQQHQAVTAESSRFGVVAAQAPSSFPSTRRPISASSWRSSIVNTEADEREPLLIPAAPPAYADIARDSTNIGHEPAFGYNTMMGREPVFFPNTSSPQDLGGAEQQPLLGQSRQPSKHSWRDALRSWKGLVKLLALILFVLAALALSVSLIKSSIPSKHRTNMPENHAGARPVPANCLRATFKANDSYTLADVSSFTFLEQHHERRGYNAQLVRISGEVRLVMSSSQVDAVKVDVEYRTNVESLLKDVDLKSSGYGSPPEDMLELWMPGYLEDAEYSRNSVCLDLDVLISIKQGASFDQIFLSLQQLDIKIEDIDYTALSTVLKTHTGNVLSSDSHSMNSREIKLHSGTGTIRGTYPLYDLLAIDSGTGAVNVQVEPKAADKHNLPARFQAESHTGVITAVASLKDLPFRDYQTSVKTGTGSISIKEFMHGSITDLEAKSASIKAKLYPIGSIDEDSRIDATTLTGTIDVAVSPHMTKPSKHMRNLSGYYSSNTGTVKVTHPTQWEGTVRAQTATGTVKLDWPGLARQETDDGWFPPWITFPGGRFEGVKGKGDALVEAKSGTGDIQLYGRDEK